MLRRKVGPVGAVVCCALLSCGASFGQTLVDLRTQSTAADFGTASFTRPVRLVSTLPGTCVVGELIFLSNGPSGLNLYACVNPGNTWALEGGNGSGTVMVNADGTLVGSRAIENFVTGNGIIDTLVDTGTQINISHAANTAVLQTKASAQAGATQLCASSSGSSSAYSCAMAPTLTAYTTGMVLSWKPDVSSTGAATLNIDMLGAVSLKQVNGSSDPVAGDIVGGQLYQIWYDGTVFRLLNPSVSSSPLAFATNVGSYPPWSISTLSSSRAAPQGGTILYFEFTAPMSMNVGLASLIPNGSTSNNLALAIFDSTCSLLAQSATSPFSAGTAVALALPVRLAASQTYYLGITSNSSSSSNLFTTALSGGLLGNLYNAGSVPRFFSGSATATWSGSSVVWPASCGTRTALAGDPPAVLLFK